MAILDYPKHSIACNCIDCNPSPTRMIGGNMNTNTTTPVAQYQFSNVELQNIKVALTNERNNCKEEHPTAYLSIQNECNKLIQTINNILAARNSRG